MEFILKNKKVIRFFFAYCIIFLLFAFFYLFIINQKKVDGFAYLGGNKINIEVVSSPLATYRGLSGRDYLASNTGMLFVFNDYDKRQFVMRDMNFPIDIIFIKDGIVKEIKCDCPPEGSEPKVIYESSDAVDMVLEVPAGYAKANNIIPGSTFQAPNNLK